MKWKGSYTVEAALIVSIYLFMILTVVEAGIGLYRECGSPPAGNAGEVSVVDDFYRTWTAKQLKEGIEETWKEK